jgi:predicted RNA binding protein YcfA (HicA-like mRNA interferase family)
MKRIDLIRHLESHSVQFLREDGNHGVYVNRATGKVSTVPRSREINDFLAQKICKDLEIPKPLLIAFLFAYTFGCSESGLISFNVRQQNKMYRESFKHEPFRSGCHDPVAFSYMPAR